MVTYLLTLSFPTGICEPLRDLHRAWISIISYMSQGEHIHHGEPCHRLRGDWWIGDGTLCGILKIGQITTEPVPPC